MKHLAFTMSVLLLFLENFTQAQSYITYPLNVGDYWQYNEIFMNEYYSIEVIGDTTFLSNGFTYKILQGNSGGKGYRRFFEDKVYYYNSYLKTDRIMYDFTLQEGDTVAVFPSENDTLIITLVSIRYANIFGLNRKQWSFLYDVVPYIDDEVYYTVTDSIGLTSAFNIWVRDTICGAIINGRLFGTIVTLDDDQTLPQVFYLSHNYPNPFNPSTKINWQVPVGSWQTLQVFDVLGNEVTTLVDEYKPAGTYGITFNAEDLQSGIYFYLLKAGDFAETKKMILIK
jgi:hypothetical protein